VAVNPDPYRLPRLVVFALMVLVVLGVWLGAAAAVAAVVRR
jgi:hypothetical protein